MVGIRLYDPAEVRLPDFGLAKVEDPETGETFWIDTSSKSEREELAKRIDNDMEKFKRESRKIGFDMITIMTNLDYVEPLLSFFKMREKRF